MNKVNQELLQETQSGWYHLQFLIKDATDKSFSVITGMNSTVQ